MTDAANEIRLLVLYHKDCNDGHCAAWIARKVMPDAEFLPVQYGEPPPDVTGKIVHVLDFSYKRPVILEMKDRAAALLVFDHHKTAREELERLDFCTFDMEKSGARLVWEHFFPDEESHWLVEYTEDRDLWRWALRKSREVNAALSSYPRTFEAWDAIADDPNSLMRLANEGEAILRYQSQVVDSQCEKAGEIEIDGHKVLCVNATTLISEIAGKLAEGRPFGMTWFETATGDRVYSLRSREGGIDVSEIAKRRGGGGHRNAAGFAVPRGGNP